MNKIQTTINPAIIGMASTVTVDADQESAARVFGAAIVDVAAIRRGPMAIGSTVGGPIKSDSDAG